MKAAMAQELRSRLIGAQECHTRAAARVAMKAAMEEELWNRPIGAQECHTRAAARVAMKAAMMEELRSRLIGAQGEISILNEHAGHVVELDGTSHISFVYHGGHGDAMSARA